jgi:phosphatidate phosphatase APP1
MLVNLNKGNTLNYRKMLALTIHMVEGIFDRIKYRAAARIRPENSLMILPYLGFGSQSFIRLKGRVLQDTGIKPSQKADRVWDNLINMYRRFESDEVPYAKVMARFRDLEKLVETDEEGYFDVIFHLSEPLPQDSGWQEVELELLEPGILQNERGKSIGQVMIVYPQAEFGVISDIDDTIIHTGVTSGLNLARTILLKNAYTRLPLKGVAEFYNALMGGTNGRNTNPLFYVSSSPWNMYDLFSEFLQLNHIPVGPMFLRDWGFEQDSMLAENNREHKLRAITTILDSYPCLRFILIGDSGQEDPEIYTQVIQSFPNRILTAYIREVKQDQRRVGQITSLAKQAVGCGSDLILSDDAIGMAEHAKQQGWIASRAISKPAE